MDLVNDALESGRAGYVAKALGVAARSEGMGKIATRADVNHQALCASLSENGNPTLEPLLGVLGALGFRLKCEADLGQAA